MGKNRKEKEDENGQDKSDDNKSDDSKTFNEFMLH